MAKKNFYNLYMSFRTCDPMIASALILGLNPSSALYKNHPFSEILETNNYHIRLLRNTFTNQLPFSVNPRNIFSYIDQALSIGLKLDIDCISSIASFYSKLPKNHKIPFKEAYPLIGEAISIFKNSKGPSRESKEQKWIETAQMLIKKTKFANIKLLAQAVWDFLNDNTPVYIKINARKNYKVSSLIRVVSPKIKL